MSAAPDRTAHPTLAAASVVAVVFLNLLGFGIIVPLLPFYAQSFRAEPWEIALIFSAFALGGFFGEPFWGRLSDRYGRKPLLLWTVTCNGLCYLALTQAPTAFIAFIIRFLGGLCSGNNSVVQGYIADVTPPHLRARRMSWLGAANAIGLIVGPSLGGLFARTDIGPIGFRIPLLICACLSASCVVALLLFIREPDVRDRKLHPTVSRWAATGEVIRHPVLSRLMLLTFLIGSAFSGIESIFGLWGHARFGWGPRQVGLCFGVVGIVAGLTQFFVTGPLVERFGERRVLAVGMATTVTGSLLQSFSTGMVTTIPALTLSALGQSISYPTVAALISRNADPRRQGQVLGLNNATGAMARVLGPLAMGLSFAHLGVNTPFWLAASIVVPAILLALNATTRRPA
ncbi:MFS transporter [Sphingobium nicotianae]|uniref:MFS transporter n=1 Tax=Sphingobium nicotianae TaxID=2782607 RepID=A0A9X1DDR6_9SPHN|nr:MFS transporter [Sphingobium nicotianae]MBT2188047.1 MFS transporter [Sphingobium nicotianae]